MRNKSDFSRRQFMKGSALASMGLLAPRIPMVEQVHAESPAVASDMGPSGLFENEFLRIEVNSKSGDITGLYNKRTGKEYIAAKQWARAFRLNVPYPKYVTGYNADYSANSLDSWLQTNCVITSDRSPGSQILRVQYPTLESPAGKFEIDVSYSIHLPDNSDEAFFQLEVANHSPYRVKEVFFPWISGVGAVEDTRTDTFVTSEAIRRIADLRIQQGANWEEYPFLLDSPVWPDGPYSLSMPWINFGGRREGLYLASLTREGTVHMLMLQNFGDEKDPILAIAWAFAPYVEPGRSWRSPEIVLSLHPGDWHAAADKYRTSLGGWHQKVDTPPDFKKPFASFNSFFTSQNFDQITDLAEDIRKYGLRDLVMWNFGDYYPNVLEEDDLTVDPPRLGVITPQWGGLARLKAANAKAHSLGVRTGIIFSQRLWNKDALTPALRLLAEKWVIRGESGDPLSETWHHQHLGAAQWSHGEPYFGHLEYIMCDAVKDWQNFAIHNIVGVLSQAGYSMMFYDQAAVERNLCFSPEHHHADANAPSLSAYDFIKSLRAAMRETNPNAILIGEGWNVVVSQGMDMGWSWVGPPNPEVFRYTLPWVFNAIATDVDRGQANKYFVLGIHLAIVAKSLENGKKLSDFPEFAQHLARLASFREKTERFWVNGAFQDDVGLSMSGAFGKVYTTSNEVAIMVGNLMDEAADASFELDLQQYGVPVMTYSLVSTSGRGENGKAEKSGTVLRGTQSLAPFEVIAVVFERQNGQT
jgi:hypothetical protein